MATTKKAAASTATPKKFQLAEIYQNLPSKSRQRAIERIDKRREDMPKIYRGNYDKSMSGKSLRSAAKAFCLECVMWQRVEVCLCPSYPCPLWAYRPYQDSSKKATESRDSAPESTNSEEGGIG